DLGRKGFAFTATHLGRRIARLGLGPYHPRINQFGHDLALVDLAYSLLEEDLTAEWRTERELPDYFRGTTTLRASRHSGTSGHKPDGLLLEGGKCIAIELELTA